MNPDPLYVPEDEYEDEPPRSPAIVVYVFAALLIVGLVVVAVVRVR